MANGPFIRTIAGLLIALSLNGQPKQTSGNNYNGGIPNDKSFSYFQNGSERLLSEYISETSLSFAFSDITDEKLESLASKDIKSISLCHCPFVCDLSYLPTAFPNLESLHIKNCASINDLSFIYSLTNLKSVKIEECASVTLELIDYLDLNGIKHNFTKKDIENSTQIGNIIMSILTDNMDDSEKIKAISLYIADNYDYDDDLTWESTAEPLTTILKNKRGVCSSFAYLANVLFARANITSFELFNDEHVWNIIEYQGKYYYLDTTNLKSLPFINLMLIKNLNFGLFYMSNPGDNSDSPMSNFNDKITVIPDSLIEDIIKGESLSTQFDKYQKIPRILIISINVGIMLFFGFMSFKLSQLFRNTKKKKKNSKLK